MIFAQLYFAFVAFPQNNRTIIDATNVNEVKIEVSGTNGIYHFDEKKCFETFGKETLISDKKLEWCSNIEENIEENPYIQYSIPNKKMIVSKYSLRNGCCYYNSVCNTENGNLYKNSCCNIQKFSLQGSNDKKTWIILHREESLNKIYGCEIKTYKINENKDPYTYIRFQLEETNPSSPKCMQINQIEFYGEAIVEENDNYNNDDENTVSIIGRIIKK